jgi:hypothetical protein
MALLGLVHKGANTLIRNIISCNSSKKLILGDRPEHRIRLPFPSIVHGPVTDTQDQYKNVWIGTKNSHETVLLLVARIFNVEVSVQLCYK